MKTLLLIFLPLFIHAQHVPSWHDKSCKLYSVLASGSAYVDGTMNLTARVGVWGNKPESILGVFVGFQTYTSGEIQTKYGPQNSIQAAYYIQPIVKLFKGEHFLQYASATILVNAPSGYSSLNYTLNMGDKYLPVGLDFTVGVRLNGTVIYGCGFSVLF